MAAHKIWIRLRALWPRGPYRPQSVAPAEPSMVLAAERGGRVVSYALATADGGGGMNEL